MSILQNVYLPVLYDAELKDIPTVLMFKIRFGIDAKIFTRSGLIYRLAKGNSVRIEKGWTDDFIADVLNDFSENYNDYMLGLIPCTLLATEFTEKEKHKLEHSFVLFDRILKCGSCPIPEFINQDQLNGDF